MTDLQINIALAKAMGWTHFEPSNLYEMPINSFVVKNPSPLAPLIKDVSVICKISENYGGLEIFDYRDPVIFVAICKHWKLTANFHKSRVDGFAEEGVFSQIAYRHEAYFDSMEKAAALVAIEYAKRKKIIEGVKL